MKKKMLLTAATAILTVGVLAACGDSDLDDPTLNEDADFETEVEMDGGNESVEEFPEEDGTDSEEFDTDFGTEEDETEEFDSELDVETDDAEDDAL
ncbi:hypothetical protein ACFFHM_20115 [Halalkalibacter kiskunsagensis]|uniref:DNA primase n=1 Tax=Halalkalibacter kiskunsagensis TaxID=1548599 RepID=A0ABV6KHB3_9BACI